MFDGKAVCIDYGKKRIGVATGSLEMKMAFAKEVFENKGTEKAAEHVVDIVFEYGASLVVLGYPLNMEEGEKNFMMREVEKFQKALGGVLPKEVEIVLFDERLSSFEAQDVFKDLREKGIVNRGTADDAYAAQVTLQRYFDRL
ncbi:Holliday junction resolvase RuvX [Candidatus Peregrinibacteria bacterium CG_4_10_14_0_2_um_filter_38_24]|nr:MAG: Holliday junction resolvase RuvX [Candidatus Peregrinibacteria bacterium CG_4_10_14_0_2_um_filter_38_24]PJC39259.1 MAG: Holliday junction resolvase RuvX [Candidatus Peregrinibacteria bacterium CG_4_9_14_0_2_um_filter_38_9]